MVESRPDPRYTGDVDRTPIDGALRVAVVGVSESRVCGVQDHALLLAQALLGSDVSYSWHWHLRTAQSGAAARAEMRDWRRRMVAEIEQSRPNAILLHYSIFSYSYRGVPIFVRPTLSALRRLPIPVIAVMHEFAYPWRRGGWRGGVWAMTHRAVLIDVMRTSRAALVTVDSRAQWLRSRAWLPKRPVAVAPVFSNLPPPRYSSRDAPGLDAREHQTAGLFGYSYQRAVRSLVLDAVRIVRERGRPVKLVLLGSPGRESPLGERWMAEARSRGLGDVLSFSGTLPAQALSDALARCDVLLFADTAGPSSRKGSLAGALASGTPVIAAEGRERWPELIKAGAVQMVAPRATAVADAIDALLQDGGVRVALGERGRAFAEQRAGVSVTADAVNALFREVLGGGRLYASKRSAPPSREPAT